MKRDNNNFASLYRVMDQVIFGHVAFWNYLFGTHNRYITFNETYKSQFIDCMDRGVENGYILLDSLPISYVPKELSNENDRLNLQGMLNEYEIRDVIVQNSHGWLCRILKILYNF